MNARGKSIWLLPLLMLYMIKYTHIHLWAYIRRNIFFTGVTILGFIYFVELFPSDCFPNLSHKYFPLPEGLQTSWLCDPSAFDGLF